MVTSKSRAKSNSGFRNKNKPYQSKKKSVKSKAEISEKDLFGDFKEDETGVVFKMSEIFYDGSTRKSFYELIKRDTKLREYSAAYDYDENGKLYDIDIRRGSTSDENLDGRASVGIRIDKGDEFAVHNHPPHNLASDNWNRASGGDIAVMLFQQVQRLDYRLQASFIMQPDGRLVRYRVADYTKAKKKIDSINDDIDKLDFKEVAEITQGHGRIDWYIETNVERMESDERFLADKKTIQSLSSIKKTKLIREKYDKKANPLRIKIEVLQDKITALDYKKSKILYGYFNYDRKRQLRVDAQVKEIDSDIKATNQEIFDVDDKLIDLYESEAIEKKSAWRTIKNKKYIAESVKVDKKELILARRNYNSYKKWMADDFGIEIQRMPKNFIIPIELY